MRLTVILTVLFGILLIGCGQAPSPAPQPQPAQPSWEKPAPPAREIPPARDMPKEAAQPVYPSHIPEWFINAPAEDDAYVYATGTAESRQMAIAIDKAKMGAIRELSEGVQANVQSMVKMFAQEAGMDGNTQVTEFYQSTSQTVANNTLQGLTPLKKYPYRKSDGGYTAYVLMGLKKDTIGAAVVKAVQNEEALYSEFKASQAFKEMEGKMATIPE